MHIGKFKGTGIILRLAVVLAMLLSVFGFMVQPAAAAASIDQVRDPGPPDYVLNTAGQFENIWWKITYQNSLTPDHMNWRLFGPAPDDVNVGPQIGSTLIYDLNPLPGDLPMMPVNNGDGTLSIFNTENNVGNGAHGTDTDKAKKVLITPAFAPGIYTSRVDFYSSPTTLDSSSLVTFNVRQPMLLFKYEDLNGDGNLDAGEPGLDDWTFTVTGPAGQEWSYTGFVSAVTDNRHFTATGLTNRFPTSGSDLLVNEAHVGAYNLSGDAFTLDVPMSPLPSVGQFISTVPTATFSSYTADGGYLELPNGVLWSGAYTFVETLKSGWRNTDPGVVIPTLTKVVNVPADTPDPGTFMVIFGNQELGRLDIFKFNDLNNSGAWDPGEPGLNGWEFLVEGTAYSHMGTTTGAGINAGHLIIENLLPGNFTVTEDTQTGWTCTTLNPQTKSVTAGETTSYTFGNYRPLGSLVVFKFEDVVNDGVFTPADGEGPLGNWAFTITGPSGTFNELTDASGYITLDNLEPGDYIVTETTAAGWICTTLNPQTKEVLPLETTHYEFGNQAVERHVPATTDLGLWILIAGLGGAMAFFVIRRNRKTTG